MPTKLIFQRKANLKQLELKIGRQPEPDRNFAKGGRSFYFFDFDDNIAFLSTPSFIFHKETGQELSLSSKEFSEHSGDIGVRGPYKDYRVDFDDKKGTFRSFRDRDFGLLEKLIWRKQQPFVEDLAEALGYPDFHWKGPSWSCFYHAVFNGRPLSLITARGHSPQTLKQGVSLLVREQHLPVEPNYLSLFPVSHPRVKSDLGFNQETPISILKQAAISASVEKAIQEYGYSPYHRFGMSDDDPENIRRIIQEMARLKVKYPEMSFFVIETHKGQFIKREVFSGHTVDQILDSNPRQLSFFG